MTRCRVFAWIVLALVLAGGQALAADKTSAKTDTKQDQTKADKSKAAPSKKTKAKSKAAKSKQAEPGEAKPKAVVADPFDVDPALQKCYKLSPGRLGHRCEPQSLPYGRCRTGNMSCRGNYELSPIGWYKCAEKNGHVTATPTALSIFILGDNSKHRINTGHVFVVEKVKDLGGGKWDLVLSHTNHDRKCSLETNVSASYDEPRKLLTMNTGHWSKWGKNLHALGFILQDTGLTRVRERK